MASLPNLRTLAASTGTGSGGSGSRSAYGTVPQPIANPQSVYSQVQGIPGVTQAQNTVLSNIQSNASGNLSTGTLNLLQDKAAQFGVSSGMPGLSGLSLQNLMQNIGLTSETLSQQGTKDYLSFLTGTGSTMLDPGLSASIADRNSVYAAAPDPRMAAEAQLGLLDRYLAAMAQSQVSTARPSSGTGANRGPFTPPIAPSGSTLSRSPYASGVRTPPGGGLFGPGINVGQGWGSDYIATASGFYPAGTPNSVTNPGTDYSDYYPTPESEYPSYYDVFDSVQRRTAPTGAAAGA